MATVQVAFRLDEAMVKSVDAIAEKAGVSRTEVVDRYIRVGLRQEAKLFDQNPIALELLNVMLSDSVRPLLEKLVGRPADPLQVKRMRYVRAKRKGKARAVEMAPDGIETA